MTYAHEWEVKGFSAASIAVSQLLGHKNTSHRLPGTHRHTPQGFYTCARGAFTDRLSLSVLAHAAVPPSSPRLISSSRVSRRLWIPSPAPAAAAARSRAWRRSAPSSACSVGSSPRRSGGPHLGKSGKWKSKVSSLEQLNPHQSINSILYQTLHFWCWSVVSL